MKLSNLFAALGLVAGLAITAQAVVVDVNADITTSTTWTADNEYRLKKQIYVQPGATLVIEAGTRVASLPADQGSLAVTRGGKIYVQGTKDAPVVMTSTNDNGTWREAINEWGNLTIMGKGIISAYSFNGNPVQRFAGGNNTKYPNALNEKQMEGLVGGIETYYGGGDDNDNSGSISYLTLRFGGKVIGLANELNGLSLGGIGRETDIHHVEIMNNVDDGVEIWGGTVNLKYISIWNIGDDSFDIDQGWRGCAQFILVVQGYSADASQGSGVGDNGFEHDGAEDSDGQPQTTGVIANATFIGQPVDGDGATAWRDNCNMQYFNSIFMDCGEKVVRPDGDDGDGQSGYGHNGTLSWAARWTTAWNANTDNASINNDPSANPGDPTHPDTLYTAQSSGNLIGFYNSVFYNNADYTEADARIGSAGGYAALGNTKEPANSPITAITRATPVVKGGKVMQQVISLDPRAANDAITRPGTAPAKAFFAQVPYAGAFSKDNNWLRGWSASDEMGFLAGPAGVDPDSTFELKASVVSFLGANGKVYTVESSTDGLNWTPEKVITGTGAVENVASILGAGFSGSKIYRVICQ